MPTGPEGTHDPYSCEGFCGLQGFCYSKCGQPPVTLAFLGSLLETENLRLQPSPGPYRLRIQGSTRSPGDLFEHKVREALLVLTLCWRKDGGHGLMERVL